MPNAAGQIWPNLTSAERPEQQQRSPSLAEAMYRPQPKPPPDYSDRESLLRLLKQANANLEAKERKR
jgi:hypothetical protein